MSSLIPAFRARVRFEAQLGGTAQDAIDVGLEEIGRAALVVDQAGVIVAANAAARLALSEERVTLLDGVRMAIEGRPSGFTTRRLIGNGMGPHHLLVARSIESLPDHAKLPSLTQRETKVLELVAHGATNHVIALRLGCAEHTVEVHMSRILSKFGVASRAELIVAIWRAKRE